VQADESGQVEVLEVGHRPRWSRTTRRLLLALLVVVCLLGGMAWLVDAQAREGEERAVAQCRQAAVRADTRASATVGFMVTFVEPALWKVPRGDRYDGLVALVAQAAARSLPQVRAALEQCRRTSVDWWHGDLADRRSAYLAYLDARVRRLEQVAADGHSYYRDQPRLAELRDAAFGT
jgi:hypothetical protein